MRAQLDAFDGIPAPRARRTDPSTSHIAASLMTDEAVRQRAQILTFVTSRGVKGATAGETDAYFGWRDGTAGRRLGEMAKGPDATLWRGGRRASPSGRPSDFFVAIGFGILNTVGKGE